MRLYQIYQKSYCEAPDTEMEMEAENFDELQDNYFRKYGYTLHDYEVKEIPFEPYDKCFGLNLSCEQLT